MYILHRLKNLRKRMKEQSLHAIFIHSYENYRYFSNFTGSNAYLLIFEDEQLLITDQRYTTQAEEQATHYEVITYATDQFKTLKQQFERFSIEKIGFESLHMSVDLYNQLMNHFSYYTWEPLGTTFLNIRKIKDEHEIGCMKDAVAISDQVFTDLIPVIKPGMTEKEVFLELEYIKMKLGNEAPAFGSIIASDIRAALPHATPTDNEIKLNHLLLIDYGVTYKGYMSDMTRTIWVGEPDKELQQLYDIVMVALEESVSAVKPGISGHELDKVARDVFLQEGLEQHSLRGLGHGVGLQIHEYPRIVLNGNEIVEENMIFTIEPGLYIPGKGGVRIEDMVLVTKTGCEVLTKTNRHIQLSLMG